MLLFRATVPKEEGTRTELRVLRPAFQERRNLIMAHDVLHQGGLSRSGFAIDPIESCARFKPNPKLTPLPALSVLNCLELVERSN
jgi:hypothetical protein